MKIFAIGRNYALHAAELKNEVPTEPVVFMKPDTALLTGNAPFYYPAFSNDIHYETEIVLKINKEGKNIAPQFAGRYFDEIGLGIDFTARDLQNKLREKGLPWELAKAFNGSAVTGNQFLPKTALPDPDAISFHLLLNGQKVQEGNSGQMLFNFNTIISFLSTYFTLRKGDLIYTGTPAGVGPVKITDRLQGYLEGNLMFDFEVK